MSLSILSVSSVSSINQSL